MFSHEGYIEPNPSWLQRLRAWRERRRKRKYDEAYAKGFNWARNEKYTNGKSDDEIESYVWSPGPTGDPFDRGALDALRLTNNR